MCLSPDVDFKEVGSITGTNYVNYFNTYMKVLTAGAHLPHIIEVYKFFNTRVFSHRKSRGISLSPSAILPAGADNASADDVLARLAADTLTLEPTPQDTAAQDSQPRQQLEPQATETTSNDVVPLPPHCEHDFFAVTHIFHAQTN